MKPEQHGMPNNAEGWQVLWERTGSQIIQQKQNTKNIGKYFPPKGEVQPERELLWV